MVDKTLPTLDTLPKKPTLDRMDNAHLERDRGEIGYLRESVKKGCVKCPKWATSLYAIRNRISTCLIGLISTHAKTDTR